MTDTYRIECPGCERPFDVHVSRSVIRCPACRRLLLVDKVAWEELNKRPPSERADLLDPDEERILCTIRSCARCGGDHEDLQFRKFFKFPCDDWNFWASCPKNGEPILLKIIKSA